MKKYQHIRELSLGRVKEIRDLYGTILETFPPLTPEKKLKVFCRGLSTPIFIAGQMFMRFAGVDWSMAYEPQRWGCRQSVTRISHTLRLIRL